MIDSLTGAVVSKIVTEIYKGKLIYILIIINLIIIEKMFALL